MAMRPDLCPSLKALSLLHKKATLSLFNIFKKYLYFYRYSHEEGVSYDKLCYFFTTTMIQALNLSGTISEHYMFNLMQVILAGLKTEVHKEFKACSIILFGCVIPRVKLNEKVSSKLLKTISKLQPKTSETLSMVAILFRYQIHALNAERNLIEILCHEKILRDLELQEF